MKKIWLGLVLLSISTLINAATDPVAFVKNMSYKQIVKDIVLSRCVSQVAEDDNAFSLDAARSANALREWIPFDIEHGDEKINALIDSYKNALNGFHSESSQNIKGVTLNCLRLYHSDELDKLAPEVILGDSDSTWNQENKKE